MSTSSPALKAHRRRWLRSWSLDCARAVRSSPGRVKSDARVHPHDEVAAYFRKMSNSDWVGLRQRSLGEAAARRRSLQRLGREQRLFDRLLAAHPTVGAFARELSADLSSAERTRVRAFLEANSDAQSARDIDALSTMLAELDGDAVVAPMMLSTARWADRIDSAAKSNRAASSGALLASAVAAFNLAHASGPALAPSASDATDAMIDASNERLRALRDALRQTDRTEVWAASSPGPATSALLGVVPPLAAAAATARATLPVDPDLGDLARRIGDLARQLFVEVAIARSVRWHNAWESGGRDDQWRRAAMASRLRRAAPPSPTTIAWLGGSGRTRADGTERTIEGLVIDIDISHRGRKAISVVKISDGAHIVDAVVPYIKADSGGLAAGCWARLTGTWRAQSSETTGAALEVGRHSLTDSASESWLDAARLLVLGECVEVPHGLEMSFSWQPGIAGAAMQVVHETWYREGSLR